jgi:hypothetical protein
LGRRVGARCFRNLRSTAGRHEKKSNVFSDSPFLLLKWLAFSCGKVLAVMSLIKKWL